MKLGRIFRYEFRYQLGHVSTWLLLAVLLLLPVLLTKISTPADGTYHNAPSAIAFFTVASGALWLMLAGAISGDAAARDVQTRMHPLTYTAPVSKASYLGGRFLAALALNALLLLAVQLGLLIGFHTPGGREGVLLGPFRPEAYLTAYAFLSLPLALVGTTVQFAAAALTRRPISSYLGSVGLFITSHFVVMIMARYVGWWGLTKLLDLVGFGSVMSSELETWTPAEQNTRLFIPTGLLLGNRLIWLGVALALLAFTYARFRLAHPVAGSQRRRWWQRTPSQAPASPVAAADHVLAPARPVPRSFGPATYIRQTLAVAWSSFGTLARSRVGLPLVALISLGAALLGSEFMQQNTIPLYPTTAQVVDFLCAPVGNVKTPWLIMPLLLVYFAGELVWREREAGLSDLADAAPVPAWALFTGKLLGLGLLLVAWMGILLLGGLLLQSLLGYHRFELGLYLPTLFGLQLLEYLLFALLALAVHALVNQKYLGHLLLLLTLGFIGFAGKLGLHHHLLVFGAAPAWSYTDIRGFGASLEPWLWFKAYWAAWALLLAVAASLFWPRGRRFGLPGRAALARQRLTRPTALTAAVAAGLVLGLGGFIFYNTNLRNRYTTAADRTRQRAEYERRYARYARLPQPRLSSARLRVELYPAQQELTIRGRYQLVNRSAGPLRTVHLSTAPGVETSAVSFGRPATAVLTDAELGYRIYRLARPLQPGDSLLLSFRVHARPRGFGNEGVEALVQRQGTYLMYQDALPGIGYEMMRELREAGPRRQHGLPARPAIPPLADAAAREKSTRGDWMRFEAVVGTAADQVAVAPGQLRRTWTRGSRRYFHYATDAPIQNQAAFFSAPYAVRREQWIDSAAASPKPVAISLYYYPGHAANVGQMLRSIRASLGYYSAQFGRYPYGHLTVVERAGTEGELNAEASTIDYGEQFALMHPDDGPRGFDLPYYVLAHEVAHQFGGRYAPVEGVQVLAEGLAVYSGMQVLEQTYGYGHLRRYLSFLRQSYEVPRSRAMAPLLRSDNAFLGYRKGPLALHALSKYIGREKVNGAVRRLIAAHDSEAAPLATTLDLYRELRAATPDSLHYLLRDLFETNTYWELKTEQATAARTAAGAWLVTLQVQARKVVVDPAGAEHAQPLNDWVEIGVIAPRGPDEVVGQPLYLHKHRIRAGRQTIRVTVPRPPARAGIDPYLLLIDVNPDDNVRDVKITASPGAKAAPTKPKRHE
jgi:ABC-type transport system involved in multi-copper enzyme maturation permease subunit